METKTKSDVDVWIDPEIFNDVYLPHIGNTARTQIFFGGSSSGKSWFVIGQRTVIDIMQGGRNYLICRAVARTIRTSVFAQIERVIREFGVLELFEINKSELTITCLNGYQILFAGLDDVEKIKSLTPKKGAITDIVIEEATETDRNDVKALYKRQRGGDETVAKRMTLLFNPILQDHWIFDEYFAPIAWSDDQTEYTSDDLFILKTWFEHNNFLTDADKQDLLNEQDDYYRDVYTWGNWGVLGKVIFTNWTVTDLTPYRAQFTNLRNGNDFGFADDPAAFLATHYDKKKGIIYIFGEIYEHELSDEDLAKGIRDLVEDELVTCDSSEPKSIRLLRKHRVRAVGARKGKDSVHFGIAWLQKQKIVIDRSCVNTINELRQYKWKEVNGRVVKRAGKPVPVEDNNHAMDALRYAYERETIQSRMQTSKVNFYEKQQPLIEEAEPARSRQEIEAMLDNAQRG